MSTVTITGTLILKGDLICDGDINVMHTATVIPVPTDEALQSCYNPDTMLYKFGNGKGSTISSLNGDVNIYGSINGIGRGFYPGTGPGANSTLLDSSSNPIKGYGASHAGLGCPPPGITVLALPKYGSFESPTSLGSGSAATFGGSAIKLLAPYGTVAVNGSITMNGQDGTMTETGGGSGGSAWIKAWDLDGTGSISANGGNADGTYGGGAGGYVSLWYQRNNTSAITMSASGQKGGEDGKTFLSRSDPIYEDKFTGHVLNAKWWRVLNGVVTLDNAIQMDATNDFVYPEVRSHYSVSGRTITVDVDHVPLLLEPRFYSTDLSMYIDDRNWILISKRLDEFVGRYSVNGVITEVARHGYSYYPATLRLHKTDSTFYFQFYDSSSAIQTVFSDVIEPFANERFNVGMSLQKLAAEEGEIIVEHFKLNDDNIANKYVSLSGPPTEPDNVTMCIVDGPYQMYGLDFYTENNRLRWDSSGLSAFTPPYSYDYTVITTLSPTESSNYFLDVPIPPAYYGLRVDQVTFDVDGTSQTRDVDFYVSDNRLVWLGTPLQPFMVPGIGIQYIYNLSPWVTPETLESLLEVGDDIRVTYSADTTDIPVVAQFDNLRVYDGIMHDYQTLESVLYVDSVNGSDSSEGRAITPLQNLFVATQWSKPGGIVVLYDGTHNSTSVYRKNITIMGAGGVKPVITSVNHLDTTGSGWETNALLFQHAQGIVKNVTLTGAENGLRFEYSDNVQVTECEILDTTTGVSFVKSDPVIMRNTIHGVSTAIDFTQAENPYVYSNIIYDATIAVRAGDSSTLTVQSNTINDCVTAVQFDGSSGGVVASNNLTDCSIGINMGTSSVKVYNNNFYGTITPQIGIPTDSSGNISSDPLYTDATDYHLRAGSPDIGTGLDTYDTYFMDKDGATRAHSSPSEIGAYEYIDGSHTGPAWYVSTYGDDHYNFGGIYDPFRTLDKAESMADSSVWVDGGHYDTFYMRLCSQNIEINKIALHIQTLNHSISYLPLNDGAINRKYISFAGHLSNPDASDFNIAINVLDGPTRAAGPAQEYGTDFILQAGRIFWGGLGLDGQLLSTDILRVIYFGEIGLDALSTLVLHPHYNNIDLSQTIYVSPNGSDSTVMGGDGTNTGGNGSLQRPYRTVQKALSDSSSGDHIVLLSGEYPIFNGLDDRVLVPVYDRTSVINQYPRQYVEDLFWSDDFRAWNHLEYNDSWTPMYSGDSSVRLSDGFINLTYDSLNRTEARSVFGFTGDFDVSIMLRNSVDPVSFAVHSSDDTAIFQYNNGDYTSYFTSGIDSRCWGSLTPTSMIGDDFITEYVYVGADGSRNGFVALSYNTRDTTSAVSIVGGPPQEEGVDYILQGEKVVWRGLGLDGQVGPSDVMRVTYSPVGLSDPIQVRMTMDDGLLRVRALGPSGWTILARRMLNPDATYGVSFYMDKTVQDRVGVFGRGYFSQFKAIAESFVGTDKDSQYMCKTERKTAVFY